MKPADPDARLERRYRRLLLAYPMDFRRDRGEEVVSTLLDAANPGQTAPSLAETCDLVYNGIRTRARRTRVTLTGPVAAHAFLYTGLLTLALATATALAVTVGVSVLGQQMFSSDGSPNGPYPLAVRVALGRPPAPRTATGGTGSGRVGWLRFLADRACRRHW
jgi:hypothetical protein